MNHPVLGRTLEFGTAVVYVDGGCYPNPGPAGSACVARLVDGRVIARRKPHAHATNNQAELEAVGIGLDVLLDFGHPFRSRVAFIADSQYVIGCLSDRGWHPRKNRELIDRLRARIQDWNCSWHWVRGHSGVVGNMNADRFAGMAVEAARQGMMETLTETLVLDSV